MDTRPSLFFLPIAAFTVFLGVAAVGFLVFFGGVPTHVALNPPVPSPMVPTVAEPSSAVPIAVGPSSSTLPVARLPDRKPEVSLLFVGDIMLDRNVRLRSLQAGTRDYPFASLPPGWFDTADYAIANLEGPVTDLRRPPEKSIDFQFEPAVIETLRGTGIDAFSQANNHALDQGSAGYADSVRYLRDAGFRVFGHQVQDGDISVSTTTIDGIRLAFFGWNTTDNPLDRTEAKATISRVRAEADVLIAYLHWGPEYRNTPHPNEVETAHWLIDQGFDAVIGGHPHWVQGLSQYKGKPIAWSLGNFIFDQDFSVETRQGLALRLVVDLRGVVSIEPIPLQIDRSQPRVLAGDERQARLDALAAISDPALASSTAAGLWSLRASE